MIVAPSFVNKALYLYLLNRKQCSAIGALFGPNYILKAAVRLSTYIRMAIMLSLYFASSVTSYGQTGKLFTVDADLSSSLVTDIHQDSQGYVWIATEDGLNKYDGIKFTIFRQNQQARNAILHNIVRVLAEDMAGRMYIGYINGLQYYEPTTADFHTIPFVLNEGVIVDAHVKSIFQRRNGQLLVGTSGLGLFEIIDEDGRLFCREMADEVPSEMIETVFEDSKGRLWISTENNGLFKINGGQLQNYLASKGEKIVVGNIVEDRDGTLWFGSTNHGLFKYLDTEDTFEKMHDDDPAVLPVMDLIITSNNEIYIATDGRGIKSVDAKAQTWLDLDVSVPTFNFSKSKMHSMLEDRDGNLWMGVYQKGVYMLPAHRHRFGYIGYKSVNRNFIGSNCVMAVYEDRNGIVWVGTDNDGLYRLDSSLSSSKHFAGEGAPGTVMTIFEDAKGNLWVGSYLDGLMRFDRETETFQQPIALTDKNGAKVERVFHITEDEQQQLWVATMGSGLFRINLNTNEVKQYYAREKSKLKPQSNTLPNDWINCILVSGNRVYLGTYDGLGCLDLETGDFVSVFGRNRLLGDEVIYSLYDDKQGNLWVGTSTGLKMLDMETLDISNYNIAAGLPSNTVWSIESDSADYIWLSTNRGVARMDVHKKEFMNFHAGDGLQGDEFMRGVSLTRSDGSLFFGGLHGVSYFDPDSIKVFQKKLSLHVVDFYLHNKPVSKETKSGPFSIIDTTVHDATVFQLAYHDNSFAIEFSTMDFSDSERVVFQYSMNGNDWMHLRQSNNRITFENLPHGTHRLQVRAVATNAVSEIKEIVFVIHPVWFLSPMAKLLYLLAAVLLIAVVVKMVKNRKRIRKQLRAQRRRDEINDAKLQLFVSLAHEIRTPLTLIDNPLKKLMKTNVGGPNSHLYRIMDRNVYRMLDLVNQMMDVQKIEKGMMKLQYDRVDMALYTKEVCALFDEQLSAKDIRLTLDLPDNACWAVIDPVNFDKVLVNVLSNACRFTPTGGWIDISLRTTDEGRAGTTLILAVADSGQQLDEKELDRIFECFYQSDSSRNHTSGTGIGLYLARQLMVLHGGDIYAENLVEDGCRFVMTLPVNGPKGAQVNSDTGLRKRSTIRKISIAEREKRSADQKQLKKLVIVDDDFDILNYLEDELTPFFNVVAFAEGEAAYKHILADPPDVIVSDLMMPVMNGFSLCSKIRSTPHVNFIPVILLTAKADEDANGYGFECGADAYITKPFSIDVLLKTIDGIVKNRDLIRKNERSQHFQDEYISNVSIKSADEKLLEKVHQFIGKNMDNPLLSVEMIASEIGISRVHLHRKLKQLTHMTTRDLIRSIRLKQAAQMMNKNGLSVSEVAYAVGYSDLSNFSISFKQAYGLSPSAYAAQKTTPSKPL